MLLACSYPTNESNFSGLLTESHYLSFLQSLIILLSHTPARAKMALLMNIATQQFLCIIILKSTTQPKFNPFNPYLIDFKVFKIACTSSQNTCSCKFWLTAMRTIIIAKKSNALIHTAVKLNTAMKWNPTHKEIKYILINERG